tara:strand:- start:1230 stop:2660 length:1431 start_codon:yes stop_codon:yes gene_type:complete
MQDNIMLMTDSYKQSHYKQYPKNTKRVYSYLESRGGKWKTTTFFGLNYFLKRYLEGQVVTQEKIDEAEEMVNLHMGPDTFNREGWQYILDNYDGRLPVEIKAVPEGTTVPTSNVLMTIENTDDKCFWLTNFLETLLVQVWYPTTVATQSREMKKLILQALKETGDESLIDFKLHDFGFRGVSSVETAGIGGTAHLVNFLGTDTMQALRVAREYYGEKMAGFSIPASEHSTITSWGRDNEVDAMRNMLEAYPTGLLACVSDSFDIFAACGDIWGTILKDDVLSRDGTLVVRPDSGYPPSVVVDCLSILADKFGSTVNDKGFRVLNPKVRLIQGDGIDIDMLKSILLNMRFHRWSADNVAFGSGGGLLQKMDRDTLKFAFKCSAIAIGDIEVPVYKEPVTDSGKNSKRGRLALVKTGGREGYVTRASFDDNDNYNIKWANNTDELQRVFLNGGIENAPKLSDVRERAKIHDRELTSFV